MTKLRVQHSDREGLTLVEIRLAAPSDTTLRRRETRVNLRNLKKRYSIPKVTSRIDRISLHLARRHSRR